jgi:hypothetical protein
VNDVRPLGTDRTRLYARHAAAFGDVSVFISSQRKSAVKANIENGEQEGADLRAGDTRVALYPAGSWGKPVFQQKLKLQAGFAYFAYAVGSPALGTFEVLTQAIDLNN